MAVTVLTNAFVSLNSVDRSAQVKSVALGLSVAELEAAHMGDTTELFEPGLKKFTTEIELDADFTDDEDDEDLYTLWNARTKFAVIIRPSATSVGAANPNYTFTAFIAAWDPIKGAHGQLAKSTMRLSNTTALTRATS